MIRTTTISSCKFGAGTKYGVTISLRVFSRDTKIEVKGGGAVDNIEFREGKEVTLEFRGNTTSPENITKIITTSGIELPQ